MAAAALLAVLASCASGSPAVRAPSGPAPAPVPAAERAAAEAGDLLYLNLVWHQHQPLYFKDKDGVYSRPWVRVHATKDYWDMAAIVERHPGVEFTVNLTPVLLRQLEDLSAGAKDLYRVLAEKPAASLSADDKAFLLARFFDANHQKMIGRFPRYAELLARRDGAGWTEQDYRDLQVWFNLAWFDPDLLAAEPLAGLVRRGRGFSEADKKTLFAEVDRVVAAVVPVHRKLKEAGRIEVITTPYAHPILPLVFNSDLGKKADPSIESPPRFSWPNDAIAHLRKSAEIYRSRFGVDPVGLWPGEGAVAQDVVPLIGKAGYRWMATGEPVLAKSLGLGSFSRDASDTVKEADALYRPYYVEEGGQRVAVVFRDHRLSDLIGFEYSGSPGAEAAADFMARLERIRAALKASGAPGPHLVSVILDGENAWENYENDGKAFFDALYSSLAASPTIKTITPTRYLAAWPDQRRLDRLAEAAWFSPDYGTWIGEAEENRAWDYLGQVRRHLAKYDLEKRRTTTPEKLEAALDWMYLAEGSDWFWWYGDDQDSGVDSYFDDAFRELLKNVYRALGDPVPAFLDEAVIRPREALQVRDFSPKSTFLAVDDPAGDDRGPGSYEYPTDPVFKPGVFDLVRFEAAEADGALVFSFGFAGPVDNPWNSPVGLSLQTVDVYIDEDGGAGTGARLLLEGRNASLPEGYGWERAVWIEGWNRKVLAAGPDGLPKDRSGEPAISVDAANRTVHVSVPRVLLGEGDPRGWTYAVVVLSQDGFPSAGVRRVRDVLPGKAQWRIGGARAGAASPRVLDAAAPAGSAPSQEAGLSAANPVVPVLRASK